MTEVYSCIFTKCFSRPNHDVCKRISFLYNGRYECRFSVLRAAFEVNPYDNYLIAFLWNSQLVFHHFFHLWCTWRLPALTLSCKPSFQAGTTVDLFLSFLMFLQQQNAFKALGLATILHFVCRCLFLFHQRFWILGFLVLVHSFILPFACSHYFLHLYGHSTISLRTVSIVVCWFTGTILFNLE